MAIFKLKLKLKLFTLFCLLSLASSTTTTPPPSTALTASQVLKTRGYHLFGSLIASAAASTDSWNGTGTVFAPPDFAFSSTTAKFNNYGRSPPPRPSTSLLLSHTLKQPLTSNNLTSLADRHELRTWKTNRCLFVSKGFNGDLSISGSKKTISAVQIRQPDLYVNDRLTIHGVDGVLDPNSVSKCMFPDQTLLIKSGGVDPSPSQSQSPLDHAVKALSKRGFSMVATAMAVKRSDLINLDAITVFAPSDSSFFSESNGFRFDFLRHVVPGRFLFNDIARLLAGTTMETLSPHKTVAIRSVNGVVTVNGVAIHSSEVYANRWIVVLSVSHTIDELKDFSAKGPISNRLAGTLAVSPSYFTDSEINSHSDHGVPSPAPMTEDWRCSPDISPATTTIGVSQAVVEGGEELFCPVTVRRMRVRSPYVDQSQLLNYSPYGQLSEELVQSGPSHQSNEISEEVVVESGPSDEDNDKCELMSSSIQSGDSSEGNNSGKKSGVPSVIDHFSIADDLFYYI
ncbi:Fasciclin-like arabinogalactan protein 21 [Camellia lanceoleosa]|uniref:Fasciclin-like arabinogalactan protein 21 n=1 Tax=Camellia lanceoleosa TaxID=1840588 RepID=A0ACC0IJZ3_9ERIC|nr:Fasciclin-like arabinogalactan protein 21 [Camellia lanceoleosa]